MRISDWSSDVCSSDLPARLEPNDLVQLVPDAVPAPFFHIFAEPIMIDVNLFGVSHSSFPSLFRRPASDSMPPMAIKSATCSISPRAIGAGQRDAQICRSEEHTSELQPLMRISYAVFCLKKKNKQTQPPQE